jgi:hypothetical protein
MVKKNISQVEFETARKAWEEAIQARAETIVAFRDVMKWSFRQIGDHFKISRQAAEKIYRENAKKK